MGLRSLFRDPWVPVTFFPAATLAVYHFPIKIREIKIVLTQHSVNAHTKPFKPWEAKTVWACQSHTGGLIWRKLFLEYVRSEPIFIWIPAQLNGNNILLICNSEKFWCSIELGQARCKRIFQGSLALLASSGTCAVTGYCSLNVTRVAQQYRCAYFELSLVFLLIAEKKSSVIVAIIWKPLSSDRSDPLR